MKQKAVRVNDKMQHGYTYELVAPLGRGFAEGFEPELTPAEMLRLGVFGGKYMTDCRNEFPKSWFARAKLSPKRRDPSLNFFQVDASQPLSVWRRKGWLHPDDPRGWFQWYCATIWGAACRKKTRGRSNAGSKSNGMPPRSDGIVRRATSPAASGSDKHCCTGPTIAERFELAPSCDGARSAARRSQRRGTAPARGLASLPDL
jgi:hypothetical protein